MTVRGCRQCGEGRRKEEKGHDDDILLSCYQWEPETGLFILTLSHP